MSAPNVVFLRPSFPPADDTGWGGAPRPEDALRLAFADRHVALSPSAARHLAAFMTHARPTDAALWGRAFVNMTKALRVSGSHTRMNLLKEARDRFVTTVAAPLCRAASAAAGTLPLLSDHAALTEDNSDWRSFDAALAQLLAEPQAMGEGFWLQTGLDLQLYATDRLEQRARPQHNRAPRLPRECDAVLAALVFHTEPLFDAATVQKTQRRKAQRVSARKRAGIKPKEGGVVGIRQSHSVEDIPDALVSEFLLPRALVTNKLLNEGFLIRHRPPRRDPQRDLLAVSLLQAPAHDAMALLVKAAWIDASIRLRLALQQMGLGNSDLVLRSCGGLSATLDCAPPQHQGRGAGFSLSPFALAGRSRADALIGTDLFPAFCTLHETAEDQPLAALARSAVPNLRRSKGAASRCQITDYGRRHVLACLAQGTRARPDWADLRARIQSDTQSDLSPTRMAALVWTSDPRTPPILHAMSDSQPDLTLQLLPAGADPDLTPDSLPLPAFMGQLVQWMFDTTLEALDV